MTGPPVAPSIDCAQFTRSCLIVHDQRVEGIGCWTVVCVSHAHSMTALRSLAEAVKMLEFGAYSFQASPRLTLEIKLGLTPSFGPSVLQDSVLARISFTFSSSSLP